MIYTLIIKSSPGLSQGSLSALKFAKAAIALNHKINQVFFYQDGVNHGCETIVTPQDEQSVISQWQDFSQKQGIELSLCVASALRRGVVDKNEAKRSQLPHKNLNAYFKLAGLGQLTEAMQNANHSLSFG